MLHRGSRHFMVMPDFSPALEFIPEYISGRWIVYLQEASLGKETHNEAERERGRDFYFPLYIGIVGCQNIAGLWDGLGWSSELFVPSNRHYCEPAALCLETDLILVAHSNKYVVLRITKQTFVGRNVTVITLFDSGCVYTFVGNLKATVSNINYQ